MSTDSSSHPLRGCLGTKQLQDYVSNEIAEESIPDFEEHVLECDRCALRLYEMSKTDSGFANHIQSLFKRRSVADTIAGGDDSLNQIPVVSWSSANFGSNHQSRFRPPAQLSKANRKKQAQQVTVRLLCKDGHYQRSVWNLAPYVEEASVLIIGRRLD